MHLVGRLLQAIERVQRGFLLRALLRLSLPAAELLPVDLGDGDEAAVVRAGPSSETVR